MTNKIPGNLLTTAMAMMPHTDVACDLNLTDIDNCYESNIQPYSQIVAILI
ncbi:MAG: hypothetical protein LWX02_07020 [Deltaproteobacteria bacterium]|nr:hypothetical protein [Deltaproteobacteria bacterium]MDL1987912.1 hypothetical protein [Deltaproteobacteria bacterium]